MDISYGMSIYMRSSRYNTPIAELVHRYIGTSIDRYVVSYGFGLGLGFRHGFFGLAA